MARIAIFVALCAITSSSVFAQIIYEPVQYQYGEQQKYYYGGSDPLVHAYARLPVDSAGRWGRVNGWAFASGNVDTHREVATEPVRTFVDSLPYRNATFFGYTPNDARNDAYVNATQYFRKRDLLEAAVRLPDGSWVVPAQARPVVNAAGAIYIGPRPAVAPRPLMIIPRDQLKKEPKSDKSFASSR